MNRRFNMLFAVGSLSLTLVGAASAQDSAPSTPKGSAIIKVYSDLYYNFTDHVTNTSGFDLTRAYLGYQEQFNDQLSGNVTYDVGRENFVTKVTPTTDTVTKDVKSLSATTDARYNAFLKTAALKWKNILPMTTLEAGMIGTNLFAPIETFWQNRFIFPTFMDQNGFGSSADLGAKATVKTSDLLSLSAEFLNGEGYKAPQDNSGNYKASLSANLTLPMGLQAVVYADEMPVQAANAQYTYSGFLAYTMADVFRIGGEYDYQVANGGVKDHDWSGFSANAAYIVSPNVYIFGRFDDLMSKSDWDKTAAGKDGTRIIAGVDYDAYKNIKIAADFQGFKPAFSGAGSEYQPMAVLNFQYAY